MNRDEIADLIDDAEAAVAELLSLDALLDLALADTFPASDPPALCSPHGRRSTSPDRGASGEDRVRCP